jgi:Fic family protein
MGFIYENKNWPKFYWDTNELIGLLAEVRNLQGRLLGSISTLGFDLQQEALLRTITSEIVKNSEIEGELLNSDEVRSSVARKLGIHLENAVEPGRDVDGVVEVMIDATQNYHSELTEERLYGWHAALFPTGYSGMYKITVAEYRKDDKGPMQVVSGPFGRERVHYEAPESNLVPKHMKEFLKWFNSENANDGVLNAGIAHLWFVTIHPFDDGNGRLCRAITEMKLAKSDCSSKRFYSMSAQILKKRKEYYAILEKTQRGDLDITAWLSWFLNCLKDAIISSEQMLQDVLQKAKFWNLHKNTVLNERQIKMVNMLFDGYEGKLTTSKWAKICKCSSDSALRDIKDLETKKILQKDAAGGRSTSYLLYEV